MTITSSINVGNGPERMVVSGENLFVCNSGGWSIDNTVSVINVLTNTVTDTWTLADRPIDIDVDANGDIWVLCSGETLYDADWNVIGHSDARLFRLSGDDYSVELDQVIGENGDHPRMMEVSADGQSVYFVNGNVYKAAIEESAFTPTVFISGDVNSLDVRANGEVWVSSVSDFVNPSTVMQYNAAGTLLNTLTAGMGSNGVVFP
jgi:DNA-binding beta-propeller fold protein YncE